ncbi:hypothetical protein CFP56_043939 [Quercus suber]|uniref:Uncharacterized protein n=1 Tax=Quercus suber TaxID=58331 RepID=A0AAW0IR12_QUESU
MVPVTKTKTKTKPSKRNQTEQSNKRKRRKKEKKRERPIADPVTPPLKPPHAREIHRRPVAVSTVGVAYPNGKREKRETRPWLRFTVLVKGKAWSRIAILNRSSVLNCLGTAMMILLFLCVRLFGYWLSPNVHDLAKDFSSMSSFAVTSIIALEYSSVLSPAIA